jgi:hypothetical protein
MQQIGIPSFLKFSEAYPHCELKVTPTVLEQFTLTSESKEKRSINKYGFI